MENLTCMVVTVGFYRFKFLQNFIKYSLHIKITFITWFTYEYANLIIIPIWSYKKYLDFDD